MKTDLPKLSIKKATPALALGALAIIALASMIGHQRPEPKPRDVAAQALGVVQDGHRHAVALGEIAVGETDAPAVNKIHSGMALIDRARFPKGLIAAHATLPVGSWIRLSNLSTGRNVAARVAGRPDPDTAYVAVLSADLAIGLGVEPGVVDLPVLVEPLQRSPRDSRVLATSAVYDPETIATASIRSSRVNELETIAKADRYLEFGVFTRESDAESLLRRLKNEKLTDGRFGEAVIEVFDTASGRRSWRVRLGPVAGWERALEARQAVEKAGLPEMEVVRR